MAAAAAVAMVAGLALAGCVGDAAAPPGPLDETAADESSASMSGTSRDAAFIPPGQGGDTTGSAEAAQPAPPLPGHSWRWQVTSRALASSLEVTTVLLDADDAAWQVGVADLEHGIHALTWHNVPLGTVRVHDRAWPAHGAEMALLSLPLADGKRWTGATYWDDAVTFEARAATLAGPAGPEPGFTTMGRQRDGAPAVAFDWSPARQQFLRVAMHFGEEEPYSETRLVAEAPHHAGSAFALAWSDLHRGYAAMPTLAPAAPSAFDTPDGTTHLLFACFAGGGAGVHRATLLHPDLGRSDCAAGPSTGAQDIAHIEVLAAQAGTWHIAIAPGGAGYVLTEVMAVTVQPWQAGPPSLPREVRAP